MKRGDFFLFYFFSPSNPNTCLSRQFFCHDKLTFGKSRLVATKRKKEKKKKERKKKRNKLCLSRQAYFGRDKRGVLSQQK